MNEVKVVKNDNNNDVEEIDFDKLILDKRFGKRSDKDLVRKRPRNKNEEKVLKRWERERGGVKIGTI